MRKDDWALLFVGFLCLIPIVDFVVPVLSPLWEEGRIVRPLTLDDTEGCRKEERYTQGPFTIFEFCVIAAEKEIELNNSEWANNSYDQCGKGSCK